MCLCASPHLLTQRNKSGKPGSIQDTDLCALHILSLMNYTTQMKLLEDSYKCGKHSNDYMWGWMWKVRSDWRLSSLSHPVGALWLTLHSLTCSWSVTPFVTHTSCKGNLITEADGSLAVGGWDANKLRRAGSSVPGAMLGFSTGISDLNFLFWLC